jgi:hypothetical protein
MELGIWDIIAEEWNMSTGIWVNLNFIVFIIVIFLVLYMCIVIDDKISQKRFDKKVQKTKSQKMLYKIFTYSKSEKTRIIAMGKLDDYKYLSKIFYNKKTEMTIKVMAAEKIFARQDYMDFLFSKAFIMSRKDGCIYEALIKAKLSDFELMKLTDKYLDKILDSFDSPIVALLNLMLKIQEKSVQLDGIQINKVYDILSAQSAGYPHDDDFINKLADALLSIDPTKHFDGIHKILEIVKLADKDIHKLGEILGSKMRNKPSSDLADKLLYIYKILKSESFMDGIHTDGKIKYTRNHTEEHKDTHNDSHIDEEEAFYYNSPSGTIHSDVIEQNDHTDEPAVYKDRIEYI